MFRKEVLENVLLRCNDFGIEIEISAAIARARKWRIYEVGISYFGRTYEEGKKITWEDGFKALWYFASASDILLRCSSLLLRWLSCFERL
jgi:hypothetical protein